MHFLGSYRTKSKNAHFLSSKAQKPENASRKKTHNADSIFRHSSYFTHLATLKRWENNLGHSGALD